MAKDGERRSLDKLLEQQERRSGQVWQQQQQGDQVDDDGGLLDLPGMLNNINDGSMPFRKSTAGAEAGAGGGGSGDGLLRKSSSKKELGASGKHPRYRHSSSGVHRASSSSFGSAQEHQGEEGAGLAACCCPQQLVQGPRQCLPCVLLHLLCAIAQFTIGPAPQAAVYNGNKAEQAVSLV